MHPGPSLRPAARDALRYRLSSGGGRTPTMATTRARTVQIWAYRLRMRHSCGMISRRRHARIKTKSGQGAWAEPELAAAHEAVDFVPFSAHATHRDASDEHEI